MKKAKTAEPHFVFKKTYELTEQEKTQFRRLFYQVFSKEMTAQQFESKYLRTPFGYSYHGLMLADSEIVGAYNTIPYTYQYFKRSVTFCLSTDTMVDERYRAESFSMLKMAKSVLSKMEQDGICFAFGFPNDQAYNYTVKMLKWQDLGELDYYLLPRNVGAIIPGLRWLNFMSQACTMMLVRLPLYRRKAEHNYCVEKVRDILFEQHRYDSSYRFIDLGSDQKCVYKIYTEDGGVRILYVIDVYPLTPAVFEKAIARIYNEAGSTIDVMLYVGKLSFAPRRMIKVPDKHKPRRIRMCGRILDHNVVDDKVLQIENWNINISNFDVR